ncbi:MAG TPA: ATP-binding protein [Alphaproteobacteria bacterium]|nr:ATP-binding protein [Alphaproteobacteria bacterium]
MSASFERPGSRAAAGTEFLAGGGEMGELMRAHDWSRSPLGSPDTWPDALKMAVSICLNSRFPMVLWWGPEFVMLYNDAWRPVLGTTKHPSGLGRPGVESWPEIWHIIGRQMTEVLAGEASWSEDLLLPVDRFGYLEEAYFTYSYSPIKHADGRIGGVFSAVTETTGRVLGERRLRILRELAEATAETKSVDATCEVFARVLGAENPDIPFALLYLGETEPGTARLVASAGVGARSAIAPERVSRAGDPWGVVSVLDTGTAVVHEGLVARFGYVPGGGWPEPTNSAIVLPVSKSGQMAGTTGVLVAGINPRRRLDDEYRGFFDLVAGQLATAIANARAYEEERRRAEALAEIDRAKTAFFSNASHEFRTPLTLMLGPLEDSLARSSRGASVPVARSELELMHRNGLRLLKLVNTLLDFSRIEAGRMQAVFEDIDLAAYTADLASTFRSAMEKAGLRFVVDCAPLPVATYVDRDMWEKVVLNLLSNAFKYTLAGEVRVSLRPAANGRDVELAVGDTGVGIPPHELPRLFERFHRIEGQQGRTQEGTGIGLALVQELIRLHEGQVRVESKPGRGTTFTVTIPAGRAHLPPDRIGAMRTQVSSSVRAEAYLEEALRWLPGETGGDVEVEKELFGLGSAAPATGERAFVVLADDNADMRDYVCRLLALRYEVEAVPDGEAALLAARGRRPDLILSDVMMPRLDGFGVLRGVRADPALQDVPVVLLSARAGEEAKVEGLEAGADDYLVKPFSARELLARVASNIDLSRARRQAAEASRRAEEALREINQTLERRVAEEIAQRMKAEESLRQVQKMEAIGQLTGGIAHDFNNLLQVMLGNLETLRRRAAGGGDFGRLIDSATRAAQRASELTSQLLAFSRRQPLQPKPIDVGKLVVGMSDLLTRTLGETISIETVLAAGLWRINADANQLESALINLAVNARDAMPGGGKLTVETANVFFDELYASQNEDVTPGQYVMIAVSDTGSGMPKDVLAKAFDPFFTTKDVGKGTGLGLSQVYGFVKQSGGHIKLYSEPGEGTTVKLYLPRLTGGAMPAVEPAAPTPGSRDGELVLVVEDDPAVRDNTVEMLRELGYATLEAADGKEALAMLEENPRVRLLFTDVGLPGGMNGRQLADAARRQAPDLLILFTTGYARNAIVHHGRLDPGVEMLGKPFTYSALATKIRQVMDKGKA